MQRNRAPAPDTARLIEILGQDPCPDDEGPQRYRDLLADDPHDFETDPTGKERAERQAAILLESSDAAAKLQRWQAWLRAATAAGTRVHREIVDQALVIATQREPDLIARAFVAVLPEAGPLAERSAAALAQFLPRPDGEALALGLLDGSPISTRAAVALALSSVTDQWADTVLAALADDEPMVRASVARAATWTEPRNNGRPLRGCAHVCRPTYSTLCVRCVAADDRVRRRRRWLPGADALAVIEQLIAGAVSQAQVDAGGLLELTSAFDQPRLVIEACQPQSLPPPAPPPLQRAEHPLGGLGLPRALASGIRGRRRQRLAGAPGGLRFGIEVLAGARPLALKRAFDLSELGDERGLDLLGAVELPACAVHTAQL